MYFPSKGESIIWAAFASTSPLPDSVTLHPARRNSTAIEKPMPRVLPVITIFFIYTPPLLCIQPFQNRQEIFLLDAVKTTFRFINNYHFIFDLLSVNFQFPDSLLICKYTSFVMMDIPFSAAFFYPPFFNMFMQ